MKTSASEGNECSLQQCMHAGFAAVVDAVDVADVAVAVAVNNDCIVRRNREEARRSGTETEYETIPVVSYRVVSLLSSFSPSSLSTRIMTSSSTP